MKDIIRSELEHERYRVVEEPAFPPSSHIAWSRYRPDLLGVRVEEGSEEIAIVECETRPNTKRLRMKRYGSLTFQPSLLHEGLIRRILAIPQGRLHNIDLRVRDTWEVWLIGSKGPTEKIGRLTTA